VPAIHAGSVDGVEALRQVDGWPCAHAAVAVAGRIEARHGDLERPFWWASVTKVATAVAVLVAAEEGVVDLDEPAGPPGATVRHLLAHASGLAPDSDSVIAKPASRRIYSNAGFEVLAAHVAARAELVFADYFRAVWGFELPGSAGWSIHAPLAQLLVVARELLAPERVAQETLDEARTVQFPGLAGILPSFGRLDPNDWGLGFELRDAKAPHWTGSRNSAGTFGHFGRGGAFLWVDPEADLALACLCDREFGEWAKEAWPRLSNAVLEEAA
jgi:CubicO group peptidase (beta-lactamase class C family)